MLNVNLLGKLIGDPWNFWTGSAKHKQEYVYSSKPFSLSLRKARLHKTLKLSTGEEFEKVVELQMETKHLESGKKHRFILYLATYGDLMGIPVRIEDQPRWWLKVRLDLETESAMAGNS